MLEETVLYEPTSILEIECARIALAVGKLLDQCWTERSYSRVGSAVSDWILPRRF